MNNIVIDDAIYELQSSGGISTLWRALTPFLKEALPEFTFDPSKPADVFISTYYQPAPEGAKSIAVMYDFIHERYPGLSRFSQDSQWKHAALARADAVIAISQWTAADANLYAGDTVTEVAYPATTLERASLQEVQAFKAKYGLPDNYVLIMGRRDLYKNVNTYWQAVSLIQQPPYTLCIGGENMASSPSQRQLRLPDSELAAAYTGALCLVYPSLYEGFGLPVLEAYACGCPIICGNGGALAEINEAALVVDVTRPREIAEALASMTNHGTRIEHIMKGYAVIKRFSWQQMAERMATVIRSVAEEGAEIAEQVFISSPIDVLKGAAARIALEATNDAAYLTEGKGVLSVPLERWNKAQQYERDTWLTYGLMLTEDRNAEHAAMFDGYKALPENIGDVIELGCGPFTNMRHILLGRTAGKITLLDPLANEYRKDHPHCAYSDRHLCGQKVDILAMSIEQGYDIDQAIGDRGRGFQYNTLVMINVLHHCRDVQKVFEWINAHLKAGGYLVFHEPARDIDPAQFYDVGHPISFNQGVIDDFLAGYDPVFRNGDYFIGVKK